MTLRLPYPNSTNTHWRHYRGRTVLSAAGRRYRLDAQAVVLSELGPPPRLKGRLAISIELTPPDARTRDLDNVLKSLLDGLESAAVFENDEQIDLLTIRRLPPQPGGAVDVTITSLDKT